MRESVAQLIGLALEDLEIDWKVDPMAPLPTVDDYIDLVEEGGLRVLVLDENLTDVVPSGGEAVDYKGHQVAKFIRERYRDLPQVIITSVKGTDELDGAAELDAIVQRDQFEKHSHVHVERMVRMGESFSKRYEEELADLARLSMKIIEGEADAADQARLDAIRQGKMMGGPSQVCMDMRSWLNEADEIKTSLEELVALIKSKE
ncbi:hypothetical protein K6X12_19155 [Xanthomonas euvesicatoria pv. allii]|uniref:hypothetical protein n=1 Tax=Xanthomonas euvesicatoria TaxID=456327 RepID=UPI0024073259|nr:hypothetical protein [Xanthomonas euvesicatoria]MCP3041191.1 hypothetical protein [Xanthomonas euvesicatoria pv. allii]MCP3053176.1 hypothetical protein [Xanthomonas euvesicatoria pv. allii]